MFNKPQLLPRAFLAAALIMILALPVTAVGETAGTVKVEVRIDSGALSLIDHDDVRANMAIAAADHLEQRYNRHWRFVPAPVETGRPGLQVIILDGGSRGEIILLLKPEGMSLPGEAERWSTIWYKPGDLAVETPPTAGNAPDLLVEELSALLDEHGEAVGETLKSVPVGIGARWHPDDSELIVLGLPWDRFRDSQGLFRIQCRYERDSGVKVPVQLRTSALSAKALFPDTDNGDFEALLAMPRHRMFAGECRPVHEVMDEVRQFDMQEILLEADEGSSLMSAAPDC